MKIKKLTESLTDVELDETNNKNLLEAEDNEEEVDITNIPKTVDPNTASEDEIAKVVAAENKANGVESNDAANQEIAQEIVDAAKDIANDTEYTPIVADNELIKALDRLLAQCRRNRRNKFTKGAGTDLLVNGLPGSGKTGIVRDWAKARGCKLAYLDAKDDEIDVVIKGLMRVNADVNGAFASKAWSRELDKLDAEDSILFLDEFNRAPEALRASLLTLINEHRVPGPGDDGYRHFPNLLFTIACINPSVPTDPGAIPLNDAEKSRFKNKLIFDSTPDRALKYFNIFFPEILDALDPNSPEYADDYIFFSKAYDLAKFIVKDPSFNFDTRDDLEMLADTDASMLNQRSLTDGLISDGGEGKDVFITWVETQSGFLDRDIQMIKDILDSYTDITPKLPTQGQTNSNNSSASSIDDGSSANDEDTTTSKSSGDDEDYSDILSGAGEEVDNTLFGGGAGKSTVANVSPADALKRIKNFDF